jgi:hypothetical protein
MAVVRTIIVYRIIGVSHDVQTLDQLNCAKRQLSLPAEFGGLDVPSLELDAEPAHYDSFTATLAIMIIDYESESLGPLYGLIRQKLLNVATCPLPWAVQLRNSYDTISTMGGFSESDLVVLTNRVNRDLSDYGGPVRNATRGVRTHASRNGVARLIQVPPQKSVPDWNI